MSSTGRIVVGGDYTPAATAALRWAVAQAAVTSASVVVVHAFDVEGRADLTLERDLDRARRDARYRTQSWVVEVLADLDVQVPVIVSTPDGSVEEALADAARTADICVVGQPQDAHRRRRLDTLRRACRCPVISIPPGPPAFVG